MHQKDPATTGESLATADGRRAISFRCSTSLAESRCAREHEIHRTTVIHHLDRALIARRSAVRKMTDESVARASARYDQGATLALVASEFGVHERTLAREFRRAGVPIRPRRGWGR